MDVAVGIFVKGFIMLPKSYLRDYWNVISFICVITR
jgi:hypothetical protein